MKTLATKLLGLLLLLAGLVLVAAAADPTGKVVGTLRKSPDCPCSAMFSGTDWPLQSGVVGGGLILAGLVGLVFGGRRSAGRISFRGEHGEVIIELGPIQKTLTRMIYSLPEVRRARVQVTPEKDGRRVQVRVEITLQNCAEQGLRRTAGLVSGCISEAVSKSLGLEDLATVQLVVKGVYVDARAAARRLHDEVEARQERESTTLEVAVARPPLSSVTMEDLKTADPEPAAPVAPEAAKAVEPAPEPETRPLLAAIAIEEPTAALPEPVAPVAQEAPTAAAQAPETAAKPAVEDIPLAVAAPPEEASEEEARNEREQV